MLKRILLISFIIILFIITNISIANSNLILTYDGSSHEYTGPVVSLILNGKEFVAKENMMNPIILDNRTLVPVREVFENLGGEVNWDSKERKVTITLFQKEISLVINSEEALVDNKTIKLDVPAKIINNKTMVPVRFISEHGGLEVDWDSATHTVNIKYPKAKIKSVEVQKINNIECIVVTSNSPISTYKYYSIPKEENGTYRLILDIDNSIFDFDTNDIEPKSEEISKIRFGYQGDDINRVVIDLKNEEYSYIVVKSKDATKLYYALSEDFKLLEDIESGDKKTSKNFSGDKNISGDVLVNKSGESINLESGDVIKNNSGDKKAYITSSGDNKNSEDKISGDNSLVNNSSKNNKTSGEELITEVFKDNNSSGENIIINKEDELKESKSDEDSKEDSKEDAKDDEDKEPVFNYSIESIKFSTKTDRIKIKYKNKIEYEITENTDPYRIILDFKETKLDTTGPTQINPKKSIISSIKFSQYKADLVRVVIELNKKYDYKVYNRSNELQIEIKESTYKNIKYKQNDSNAQITLSNVQVSDFSTDILENGKSYKLTYKGNQNNYFGDGELSLNDRFVEYIKIEDDVIFINSISKMDYSIRNSLKNVVITIREKEEDDEEIENQNTSSETKNLTTTKTSTKSSKEGNVKILIDVGHGGVDPGACNGDAQEKVYNLAIAKILYELLEEEKNVTVYIDRDDDSYLNRDDRVSYAKEIDPDFIVSIHNNSSDTKSYSGTMVMYYNNDTESNYGDITSRECAKIVQEKLIEALDTYDRGTVSRQDLHILSKTPCPSILCEVCFISNDEELARLKTKSFQKDAANAIYQGIKEIIKELN